MSLINRDVDAQMVITRAIGPVSIATDTNTLSSAVDLTNYPGWKVLLIHTVGTRTDGSYTATVVQSDTTGGSYSATTATSGTMTATAAANTQKTASYTPTKGFLKVNIASTGTTSGALNAAYLILVPPVS